MARATGIEITGSTVRITELEGSPRKARILGCAEVPFNEEAATSRREALQQALKTAFKASKAKKEHVVFGVPARETVIREILIPFTDVDQIRKVVKFESESHLHGVEIDEVVVDFLKIAEVAGRSRVLVAAVRKDSLREYLQVLSKVGVDPAEIDLDAAALFARARQIDAIQAEGDGAYAIVDIGERTSTIVVGRGENLALIRCVRLGSDTIVRSISHDLGVERGEARTMTLQLLQENSPFANVGDSDPQEMSTALTATQIQSGVAHEQEQGLARRLVGELRRSLSSSQLEGKLQGIYLTGPTSASAGIERALVEAFEVKVAHLDNLQGLDHSGLSSQQALSLGATTGLALKGLGYDPLGLDFRQEDLRFTKRFDKIKGPIMVVGFLCFVLFVMLGLDEYQHLQYQKRLSNRCAGWAKDIFEAVVVDPGVENPKALEVLGFKHKDELAAKKERLARRPKEKWLVDVLSDLESIVSSINNRYGVQVGESSELAPEEQVVSALERMSQFFKALQGLEKKIGEGKFTLAQLEIGSESIRWDMKIIDLNTWPLLEEEFKKLDGYVDSERGTRKPAGDGWSLLQNCRLEFEKEG